MGVLTQEEIDEIIKNMTKSGAKKILKPQKIDVKTFITVSMVVTVCIGFIFVMVADFLPNHAPLELAETIVTVFVSGFSSLLTYYFTRKSISSIHNLDEKGD